MENNKYNYIETVPKSNLIIVGRDKIDTPNNQTHNRSL
jgi:hypothetical protein